MIDVDNDHLGRTTGGATRLDRAGSPVADLQEGHEARRATAARQLFAFAAQIGEVGTGAGAVFEQTRFADPEVHDAAFVDQVVLDRLDEAGMRLRVLIGRLRLHQLGREGVDIEMSLAGAVDAIGPVQAGVEPLRRIRCDALGGEHVGKLVLEGGSVFFGGEILALPAPIGPGAGQAIEDLAGIGFRAVALVFGQAGHGLLVGDRPPEEGGNVVLLDSSQDLRHAGLAEIFLGENVGRHLAELCGHVDVGKTKYD